MPTRTAFIFSMLVLLLVGGCFNRERQPVYVNSEEIRAIQVPPGLDQPNTRNAYEVPGYSVPELAAQGGQERPPEVLPSAQAEESRSHIRFGSSGLYLAVEDEPDSVWRRLGFSLNRGDMQLQQTSTEDRRYRFSFSHEAIRPEKSGFFSRLAFWREAELIDYSGLYMARVVEGERDGQTRVELLDADGSVVDMDRAEFVLARLRDRLG